MVVVCVLVVVLVLVLVVVLEVAVVFFVDAVAIVAAAFAIRPYFTSCCWESNGVVVAASLGVWRSFVSHQGTGWSCLVYGVSTTLQRTIYLADQKTD